MITLLELPEVNTYHFPILPQVTGAFCFLVTVSAAAIVWHPIV
jgi:hypothetical protein